MDQLCLSVLFCLKNLCQMWHYQDDSMLYIDPVDCIDCEACVPECAVDAIFAEHEVPGKWQDYTKKNADKSAEIKAGGTGHITEKQDPKLGPNCKKA